MSIFHDPAAARQVERLRRTFRVIPWFAAFVIAIGVAELIGVGWFVSNKWVQYVENTDRSHKTAVQAGMIVGAILGGGDMLGLVSIAYGLWMLFRRKADGLLLILWEELVAVRAADADQEPVEPIY